jgi:hypothetical protein
MAQLPVSEIVITDVDKLTPEWLTARLQKQGVLERGEVRGVVHSVSQRTFASLVWHLQVSYTDDATPGAPTRLFLKSSTPALAPGEFNPDGLRKEVLFYRTVAPAMNEPPSVRCYDAAYSSETKACHVLLEDVSETHYGGHEPSRQEDCERAMDCLARFHAFWWDHPRLVSDLGGFPTPAERAAEWVEAEKRTREFMQFLGNRLLKPWRMVYESVLPALPHLYERHSQGRNFTLAHGDAHLGNFLFPHDRTAGKTYLVDWQFWHPTIGGTDLAFMIATEWEPTVRCRLEEPLVRRYYARLLEHGVRGYGWEDCWYDYRLSVILVSIFIPVWRWSGFKWEPDVTALERSMQAFEELRCSDLLSDVHATQAVSKIL